MPRAALIGCFHSTKCPLERVTNKAAAEVFLENEKEKKNSATQRRTSALRAEQLFHVFR